MCPLEGTTAFATSSRIFTCNGILAMVYLQWFTCDASFHSIEIMITSSHMDIYMKANEILRITVKTVCKSEIETSVASNCKQFEHPGACKSQVNYLQRLCRDLVDMGHLYPLHSYQFSTQYLFPPTKYVSKWFWFFRYNTGTWDSYLKQKCIVTLDLAYHFSFHCLNPPYIF